MTKNTAVPHAPDGTEDDIGAFHVMEMLRRADDLRRQGADVIHLGAGEPDFEMPGPVKEAIIHHLESAPVKYTEASGMPELRAAIAGEYRDVHPDRVMVTHGSSGALDLVLRYLLQVGDEVLLKVPGYPCNENLVKMAHGVPRLIPVDASTNFHLTLEYLERHWNRQTRAVIITSPCNPTGAMIPDDELRSICKFVDAKGGYLIWDEVYRGISYERQQTDPMRWSDRVIVINSFSKFFGLTGLRIGWCVVPEPMCSALVRRLQNQTISVNTLSQCAAIKALSPELRGVFTDRTNIFRRRRDLLVEGLRDIGFDVPVVPEGAFYVYANIGNIYDNSYRFATRLLDTMHVSTTPGIDFSGTDASSWLRLSFTVGRASLSEALSRIRAYLSGQSINESQDGGGLSATG